MLSHTLQFAILLSMFTNITQHTFYLCWIKSRQIPHHMRFGPAYSVGLATLFIMVHPTYIVLKVGKQVARIGTPWGHVLHACTVVGYLLLFLGVLWATGTIKRLRNAYYRNAPEL